MSMSFVSMVEAELPPGFRFHPRDDELVCDYLAPKVRGTVGFSGRRPPVVDVDLNKVEPWDLPAEASVGPREWYFFSLKDRKYATGLRANRATVSGYWKATGKDRAVARRGMLVGMRKTLVFYQGRAPKGRKTEWVMHEYRMMEHEQSPKLSAKEEDWVLCRVICKKTSAEGGATAKPARGLTINGYDTATTTSPPLPALMDTTLAQLQVAMNTTGAGAIEQVPCFSSFNNITSNSGSVASAAQPCYLPMATSSNSMSYLGHGLPELSSCFGPLNSDEKLLKAVLSELGGGVMQSLSPDMTAAASSTWMNHF